MIVRVTLFGSVLFDPSLNVGVRVYVDVFKMAPNGGRCLLQMKINGRLCTSDENQGNTKSLIRLDKTKDMYYSLRNMIEYGQYLLIGYE